MAFTRVFKTGIPWEDWVKVPKGYRRVYKGLIRPRDKLLNMDMFAETNKFAKPNNPIWKAIWDKPINEEIGMSLRGVVVIRKA